MTLDLIGRIPTPDRVATFVAGPTSGKRAKLIDEPMAKREWLYQNNFAERSDPTISQWATNLIAATGSHSYADGT